MSGITTVLTLFLQCRGAAKGSGSGADATSDDPDLPEGVHCECAHKQMCFAHAESFLRQHFLYIWAALDGNVRT